MPLVKTDIPNLLEAGLKAVFFEEYDRAPSDWGRIATVVPSTADTEDYAWLGSAPAMREFKDERVPAGLLEQSYSIKNRTWEASIAVERAALEDERYGQIKVRIQGLGREARRHQDELVFSLLKNGFGSACYDGQYFFDTDHSEGESGTQSNKGTSALSATSLQSAISAMVKFKDDRGKPLGVIPDVLVVPPDLQWTAMELLNSAYYPDLVSQTGGTGGTQKLATNVLKGRLDLVVSPYLTDGNDWFLLCTTGPVKPVVFQSRVPVEFSALEGNSETGFMRDEYLYGVRARYNVGYGLWQMAYGSQGS
ncbi:MAG: Mu-like prophage major head subunit gpT family protein [Armatimonadota bacterium]|nr:Mu-like prophage major head subunit gpT family protein [Armatimonadota bacterium]